MTNSFLEKRQARSTGAGTGSPTSGHHDTRSDLGYGKLTPKFHVSKVQSAVFPYLDEDDAELPEEEILDDELVNIFLSKTGQDHVITDPAAAKGTNPYYFAAGNTKLYECFLDPDKILREVDVAAGSMFSVPSAYKTKEPIDQSGASFPHGVGIARIPGEKKGYASRPPSPEFLLSITGE